MAKANFINLRVYQLSEVLSDQIWDMMVKWSIFARDTVGKQLVRAADSIGANISEGAGRGSFQDNRRFVRTARASLYETQHFLRRAFRRELLREEQIKLLKPLIQELGPKLNSYLKSIGRSAATDNGQLTTDK
jgi:four helix bundle protein